MAEVTIRIRPYGPYVIEGDVNLVDNDGNPVPLPEGKTTMKLCRCGASVTKPFCDGTHSKIGFLRATEGQQEFDAAQGAPAPVIPPSP